MTTSKNLWKCPAGKSALKTPMKTFKNIYDKDTPENGAKPSSEYTLRPTVKAIVVDNENNIALLKARGHYLLPGGGIETGESAIDALRRELIEEIGCNVDNIKELGISSQFRNKNMTHYEVVFFSANVVGKKGTPTTTQEDELQDVELFWFDKEKVFTLLKSQIRVQDKNEYSFYFNSRSHFEAFEEYCLKLPEV